ncbi:hypothetical protein PGTUg99_036154 [Puccinia graminis f. sp. tritici]|uniref:Uncharacterized protein n=1 Tax=Puccinia graminis f. sp. tritici TaxID=56615 RepID=A0A5B0SEP1_PUCGR|nr:hypothetical protein PGTUg99_036154 [Puccinia graminis f. sp. tritici]
MNKELCSNARANLIHERCDDHRSLGAATQQTFDPAEFKAQIGNDYNKPLRSV